MKKILIALAIAETVAIAGEYVAIVQPDGTVVTCYQWDDGTLDCRQ